MLTLTLANEKGGVGKTTMALTIACGLAAKGQRVLLVDADAQGHAAAGVGVKPVPALYDLLVREAEWKDVLRVIPVEKFAVPGESLMQQRGQLYLLAGNTETMFIEQQLTDADLLADRLNELRGHLDMVIFDTSPTPSKLHGVIYAATDIILLPTQCEVWSLTGVMGTISRLTAFNTKRQEQGRALAQIGGIIPNLYNKSRTEHSVNLENLRKRYGDLVWDAVSDYTAWPEAAKSRCPVYNYNPGSKAARQAWGVIERVEQVVQQHV